MGLLNKGRLKKKFVVTVGIGFIERRLWFCEVVVLGQFLVLQSICLGQNSLLLTVGLWASSGLKYTIQSLL